MAAYKMSITTCLYYFLAFFVVSRCEYNTHGLLNINEDKLRNFGSPRSQKEAICRYLCGRGPIRTNVCFCKVELPCMDSYCPKDNFCRKIDSPGKNLYACCPYEKKDIPQECKGPRYVVQVRHALRYYQYNMDNRKCEEAFLYSRRIKIQNVPGYSSAYMCRICTLNEYCSGPDDEKFDNLESIFSFDENKVSSDGKNTFLTTNSDDSENDSEDDSKDDSEDD